MQINDVSGQIVDAAMTVHSVLGPGLLEAAYQVCLAHELRKRGLVVRREVRVPVRYDGVVLDVAYRIDLLVEECVVVEIKVVSKIIPVHEAQLLSQLKLGDYRVGLLINFNVAHLKDGIVRKVNRL
ncbi:MAG: GxxExxY protein [Gemmatimonadaceae bacterium]